MSKSILELASWGKYIYRAEIQRHNFENKSKDNESSVSYFINSSQWLASLYVVVEGWNSIKESDAVINEILSAYEDYVFIIKRCRNAVFHYQKGVLDKRVEKAVTDIDILTWAGALLDEFIRFLYIYPFNVHGVCKESLDLQNDYLNLIGWVPTKEGWVMWYDQYIYIYQYFKGNNPEILIRTPENDKVMENVLGDLKSIKANPYISMLSRMKSNV